MKNLRLAEFAVALARHRHFARAAASMGISQPTFSRAIASLEKRLGIRLFERSTRHVEPTSAGLEFVARAELLLQEAAQLGRLVSTLDKKLTGQLAIGSGPYPLEFSVLPAVARLTTEHPGLSVRVVEGRWRELAGQLQLGAVDVVVLYTAIFAGDHRVEIEPLPHRRGALVCRAGHPLTRLRRVAPADIRPYPFVGVPIVKELPWPTGRGNTPFMVDHLTGDIVPRIATTSLQAMRELVQRTDGIGLCPPSEVRPDVLAGRLALLDTDFEIPHTEYGMVWLKGRSLSPAARAFMAILREVEAEHDGAAREPARSPAARPPRRKRR
jgi:DNA-binding transcriptional LysR family regulator